MESNMFEDEKYDDGIHAIYWRSTEKIEIDPHATIPLQYLREQLSYEPDKKQMTQDIKCGAKIDGVNLVKRRYLVVK